VIAPGFLPFPITAALKPQQLRSVTQCVIRDTARNSPAASYFLIEGAHQCTVADQLMKKEVIVNGMSWGTPSAFPDCRGAARRPPALSGGQTLPWTNGRSGCGTPARPCSRSGRKCVVEVHR
jgi:hypothetical protein